MKKEKSAGVIIFYVEDGKPLYLLLKYQRYGRVHWGFVKGNIDKGETEEETAKREAEEEAGFKDLVFLPGFKESQHFFFQTDKKELVSKDVIFFLAETKSKNVKLSHEHSDHEWPDFESALKILRFKNQKLMLAKANEAVLEWVRQKNLA